MKYTMTKKRVLAILLVVCTLISMPQVTERVFATSATDKKEEAEDKLDDLKGDMEDIKDSQQQVQGQITDKKTQLGKILAQMDQLSAEIAETQKAVEQTNLELEKVKKEEQEQYAAMKLRIQYMYENSTQDSFLEAILGAKSFADLLKRVEYVAAVHAADRELTEQYKETVKQVEEKQATLMEQMDTLLAKQETFLGQRMELEGMIADLGELQDSYATQLANAEAKAAEYQKIIEEQNAIIIKEEEERRRKEEEERKRREEEERKKREEEEKKKQEEAEKNQNNQNNQNNNQNNTETDKDETVIPTVPLNPKGQDIVDYACKFVGYPYVYGGKTDLTKGVDCSGFVNLVYKHFGYKVPSYSMNFLYAGVSVPVEEIQPGDIVVYAAKDGIGHVAIYKGDGKIVEAQSTKAGITDNRNLHNGRKILSVRRILD